MSKLNIKRLLSDNQIKAFINPNGNFLKLLNNNFRKSQDSVQYENIKAKEFKWGVDKTKKYNIPVDGSLKFWSGAFGEYYVYSSLISSGNSVRRPSPKNGFTPDWECDKYIYEVKTRNYTSTGSAGEKALAVPLKYCDIPELYKKPLKIILVGRMEYDGIYKYNIIDNKNSLIIDKSGSKQFLLDTYNSMGIKYVGASE